MFDYLGAELKIGDTIVFIDETVFSTGTIVQFSKNNLYLLIKATNGGSYKKYEPIKKISRKVIKISETN